MALQGGTDRMAMVRLLRVNRADSSRGEKGAVLTIRFDRDHMWGRADRHMRATSAESLRNKWLDRVVVWSNCQARSN